MLSRILELFLHDKKKHLKKTDIDTMRIIKLFIPNAPFLRPLKTSENLFSATFILIREVFRAL